MAEDFKATAARQRLKILAAAKAQVSANIARYESEGDVDSASDEIQAYSNLEFEEQNLIGSFQRYQAASAPRQSEPISDSEFLAMSPERMLACAAKLRLAGLEQAGDILPEGIASAPDRVVICPYGEGDAPHYGYWQSQYGGIPEPQGGRLIYEGEE